MHNLSLNTNHQVKLYMKIAAPYFTAMLALLAPLCGYSQSDSFSMSQKPVWEAGIGAGYLSGFDYPGSKDPNTALFALPFFIYRSEIFRVGDGGVGAVAVERPRLKVDVSFGGALNAESEAGSVREGLPDLDLLFEFGPRLQYRLYDNRSNGKSQSSLDWDSKLRAVIGIDSKGIEANGYVFSTGFGYRQKAIFGDNVDLILNTDITFGDQRFNDNFYTVAPEFATAQRSTYTARAGYVESRAFLGLAIRPTPTLRIFTGLGLFSYANSANEESPLFETNSSVQYALGLAWAPFRSKKLIDVFDTN